MGSVMYTVRDGKQRETDEGEDRESLLLARSSMKVLGWGVV